MFNIFLEKYRSTNYEKAETMPRVCLNRKRKTSAIFVLSSEIKHSKQEESCRKKEVKIFFLFSKIRSKQFRLSRVLAIVFLKYGFDGEDTVMSKMCDTK